MYQSEIPKDSRAKKNKSDYIKTWVQKPNTTTTSIEPIFQQSPEFHNKT